MKTAPAAVVILALAAHCGIPAGWAAEEPAPPSSDQPKSLEEMNREMERIRQRIEKIQEDQRRFQEERKEEEQRQAKIAPLLDQAFQLLQEEKYAQVRPLLREWERIDPKDPRIPLLKDLLGRMEGETDPAKKEEALNEFLKAVVSHMTETLEGANKDLQQLNQELEGLGPQDAGEELCAAVAQGDLSGMEAAFAKGASPNGQDRLGNSALIHAAIKGHAEAARVLLDRGAEVNAAGSLGMTALIMASSKGHLDLVRMLVERGAEVNAAAETGVTALQLARRNHHAAVADYLTSVGAQEPPAEAPPEPEVR